MNDPRTQLSLPEVVNVKPVDWGSLPERFWTKVDRSGDCWMWTAGRFDTGYGAIWHSGRVLKAHRVAWALANGTAIEDDAIILHTCDQPACVRPEHLRLGTMADNTADMLDKGRGHRHGRRVLDEDKVREIRRLRADGLTLKDIASRFGVSWVAIHLVVTGKRWGDVA